MDRNKNAIIVWDDNWHAGVIGIVAAKLSNLYKEPAFIVTVQENDTAKGGGRANSTITLYELSSK
ncbi:DHHA1 domain-containing protein, partial [Aliarcobacter butzleri]|uniref:DHHA1 domain-containing protein n=1 Tax=Aliarcobacter butzleri TaxID=28197 RepID=UPI003AF5B3F4